MRTALRLLSTLLCISAATSGACVADGGAPRRGQGHLAVEVVNGTGVRIDDLRLVCDGAVVPGPSGVLDPGYSKSAGDADYPRDDEHFALSWTQGEAGARRVDIPVAAVMPPERVHTLSFELGSDGSVVARTFRSFAEWTRRDREPRPGRRFGGTPKTRPTSLPATR